MTHFLQSEAWEQFQKSLERPVVKASDTAWSYRAFLESGTFNARLYTPYGPSFNSQEALEAALISLVEEGKKHKATFIRIEPTRAIPKESINKFRLKKVTYQHLQPMHTQRISLDCPSESLLANMSQNTRNIVRNYHKKGVEITTSQNPEDITILLSLLQKVAQRTGLRPQPSSYLVKQAQTLLPTNNATLYIARHESTPVAAALFFDDKTTRYYAHAAADDAFRKLQPGTALLGQAILDAKARGQVYVDLYGITPSLDKNHPWAGFTRFKQSFGGSPVTYGGAWDLPLRPFAYRVYRSYQSLRNTLRAVLHLLSRLFSRGQPGS